MVEQLYNNVTDTLAATINSSANTLAPGTPAAWPSTGNYRIECEGEIMVVTSNDGTLLHVTRGQEGTTAAAHATGATMQLIPTAGGMAQWRTDLVASVSNNSSPRASVTASYLSTPGLANVYLTVLKTDGTTILARTTSGVTESGTVPGLYQATITYASVAPNLELIIKWDEGTIGAYTPDLVQWPSGAGSVWRSGSGVPSNSLGIDGDMYFRTDTADIYQRTSGVYTVVANIVTLSTVPSTIAAEVTRASAAEAALATSISAFGSPITTSTDGNVIQYDSGTTAFIAAKIDDTNIQSAGLNPQTALARPRMWSRYQWSRYRGVATAVRETVPWESGPGTQTFSASGDLDLGLLPVEPGDVLTKLAFFVGSTAMAYGSNADGHVWMVVTDSAFTVVKATADQGQLACAANAYKEISLSSTYTVPAGVYELYVGLYAHCGTGGSPVLMAIRASAPGSGMSQSKITGELAGPAKIQINGGTSTGTVASGTLSTSSLSINPYIRAY